MKEAWSAKKKDTEIKKVPARGGAAERKTRRLPDEKVGRYC